MAELLERVKLSLLVNGDGVVDNFKNNCLFFYDKYQKSDEFVKNININDIQGGGFYFFHYKDDSNWMKYSPVFVVSYKKFDNKIVIFAVNFNFIPIEIRTGIFDKYININDFEKNNFLKVDYNGVYEELRRWGFEYALMEFNASQIVYVHKIHLDLLPRFLYHQHPINKYDPKKLIEIWQAKLETRDLRHKEMSSMLISELYEINSEISEKYNIMKDHIKRVQVSLKKYGK